MKNALWDVILSKAKNLSLAIVIRYTLEILRFAQNDMSVPVFYGVLPVVRANAPQVDRLSLQGLKAF